MEHRKLRAALASASLALIATQAGASIQLHFINKTKKPAEFSLMIPRTKVYSALNEGKVPAQTMAKFSSENLLPMCTTRWQCSKLRLTVQHWGSQVVFIECPKLYNSRHTEKKVWLKLVGNDSAHLHCRRTQKPKPA